MGLSVQDAQVSIAGMHYESRGPLLITHWGFSGPAVLRLSSLAARELFERAYKYKVVIDWLPEVPHEELREFFYRKRNEPDAKKKNSPVFELPRRLWEFLLGKAAIPLEIRWTELSNRMAETLLNTLKKDAYDASGKTTFKEEFVTCGGVNTAEVDFRTMQSKKCPGLYFAGEVLNIDGLTGGFNFQNAWTTAWVAAEGMGSR
jgi:predicted Rossmann fold flavoprotein